MYIKLCWIRGSHSGDYEEYHLVGRNTAQQEIPGCCLLGLLFNPDDGDSMFL
jgi:hypothetical protein